MSAPLSAEQRALILAQLGDAQPATDGLLESFGRSIADMRQHAHPSWEDLFCMNLSSYMGERAAPVLRRLLDAEAQAERWQTTAASWRERYYAEAGTRWDDELPPGGEVCATCEQPVESEPCREHNPRAIVEQLDEAARERWIEKQLAETGIKSMDFRNGMAMDIEPARDMVAQWVGAARAMLGDAPNYSETPIEMEVKVGESPERFAFILQRVGKLTPHEARQKAEARVAELERLLSEPRKAFLAEYEMDEPRLYLTLDAARDALTTARTTGDPLVPWAWQEQDGVWSQWRTDQDDRPVELLLGSIMRVALPAGLLAGGEPVGPREGDRAHIARHDFVCFAEDIEGGGSR